MLAKADSAASKTRIQPRMTLQGCCISSKIQWLNAIGQICMGFFLGISLMPGSYQVNNLRQLGNLAALQKYSMITGDSIDGMIAENICIRPSSSIIAQANMTLTWMSGAPKRNLSDGSEPPATKLLVSSLLCFPSLTFVISNTFVLFRCQLHHPFSQCNGVLHCNLRSVRL
jgi:hypothetical protein